MFRSPGERPVNERPYFLNRPRDLLFRKLVGKSEKELRELGLGQRSLDIVAEWKKPAGSIAPELLDGRFDEWVSASEKTRRKRGSAW